MNIKKGFLSVFTFTFILFFIITNISCQIGLGAAVDTEQPVVQIEYPPKQSVIRGEFLLAGICNDDKGVSEVKVTASTSAVKNFSEVYQAELAADGLSWKLMMNAANAGGYNGWTLPDGTYNIEVTAYDESGKSITDKVVVDIDNTAPVLILSNPLTYSSTAGDVTTISEFGQILKFSGEEYDAHKIKKANLKLYNYQGGAVAQDAVEVSRNKYEGVAAGFIMAKYFTSGAVTEGSDNYEQRANYLKVYNDAGLDGTNFSGKGDTINYYFMELEDEAGEYKGKGYLEGYTVTGKEEEGNKSEKFYLKSKDFNDKFLSDEGYGLTASQLYEIINGTSSNASGETIKSKLAAGESGKVYEFTEELAKDGKGATFSINPNNNPKWDVSGYAYTEGEAAKDLVNNSDLIFSINAGKDQETVDASSVKITVKREDTGTEVTLTGSNGADGTSLVVSRTISGLTLGKTYEIKVEGEDYKGNAIEGKSGTYKFKFVSNGAKPVISLDPKGQVYTRSVSGSAGNVSISGSLTGGTNSVLKRTVYVNGTKKSETVLDSSDLSVWNGSAWTDVISETLNEGAKGLVKAEYSAKDDEDKTAETVSYTYFIDNQKPEYLGMKVGGKDYADGKWSNKANFTLNGTWEEAGYKDADTNDANYRSGSGITGIDYWIRGSESEPAGSELESPTGTVVPGVDKDAGGNNTDSFSFDQIIYGFSEGNNYLYMRAKDAAGNVSDIKKFKLNVDMTAPELTLNESAMGITGGALYVTAEELEKSGNTEGVFVKGSLTDGGSGVNKWQAVRIFEGTVPQGYRDWKESADEALPAGARGTAASYANGAIYHYTNEVGFLAEPSPDGSFSVKLDKTYFSKNNGNYKDQYTITVVGEDERENRTTKTFTLTVDSTAPAVEINSIQNLIETTAKTGTDAQGKEVKSARDDFVNGSITVQGTSTDENKVTETKAEVFAAGADGKASGSALAASGLVTGDGANSTTKWKYTVDTTKLTDIKEYIIRISSTDESGNTGKKEQKIFVNQATDDPTYESSNATESTHKGNLFGMSSWKILGNVGDDDGVAKVEVKLDNGSYETKYDAAKNADGSDIAEADRVYKTSRSMDYEIERSIAEGNHTLTVKVTDRNGKAKESAVLFSVDKESPKIQVYLVNGTSYTEGMLCKGSFNIEISAEDTMGVESVKEIDENGDEVKVNGSAVELTRDAVSGKYVHSLSGETAAKTRYYRVTDNYGRTAETQVSYTIDITEPVLDYSKIRISGGTNLNKTMTEAAGMWFTSQFITVSGAEGTITEANLDPKAEVVLTGATAGSHDFNLEGTGLKDSFELTDGTTTIRIVIRDKAGNEQKAADVQTITVKKDETKPVVTVSKMEDAGGVEIANRNAAADSSLTLTNTGKVKVTFTAGDATSGLKNVWAGFANGFTKENAAAKLFASDKTSREVLNGNQSLEVATPDTDGKATVWILAEDIAGNTEYFSAGSFILDKTAPVVNYTKPVDGTADVNKKIDIEGTVTEANRGNAFKPVLKIKTGNAGTDADWETLSEGSVLAANVNTFKFTDVDTEGSKFTDEATNILKVEFTDKAGNRSSALLNLGVDQSKDIPVITLNNIDTDGSTILNDYTISGSVTDDDAVTDGNGKTVQVEKLEIQIVEKDKSVTDSGWKTITPQAGTTAWTYSLASDTADKDYDVYFRVKDKKNEVFTSGTSGTRPYVKYSSKSAVQTKVSFSFDKEPPVTETPQISTDDGETYEELKNNQFYGGSVSPAAVISIKASDKVTAAADLKGYISFNGGSEKEMSNTNGTFTYSMDLTDNAAYPNGLLTIQIKIRDKAQGTATVNRNITVDNLKPTEKETADADGTITKSARVPLSGVTPAKTSERTGTVTVSGQVSDDETAGSGIKSIAYYLPPYSKGGKTVTTKKPEDVASGSWISSDAAVTQNIVLNSAVFTLTLDSLGKYVGDQAESGKKNLYKDYENDSGITGIYDLPVWFRVTDKQGNTGYYTDYYVHYNPNADKPSADITSPEHNRTKTIENAGAAAVELSYVTLGGSFTVRGTAEDDEGIDAVYVQYDINGDGKYDATDRAWLEKTGSYASRAGTKYTVETIPTTTDWGIKAVNKTSWSHSFNAGDFTAEEKAALQIIYDETNEKYSGKTLNIRAKAVDLATFEDGSPNNQYASSWSKEIHVSINSNSPQFSQELKVKQYPYKSGSQTEADYTKAPLVTRDYSPDMYISGSNWRIEGSVSDPDGTIDQVTVLDGTTELGKYATVSGDTTIYNTAWFTSENENKTCKFHIPVTEGVTKWAVTIRAEDNASPVNTETQKISLNVDNTAPALEKLSAETDAKLKIYSGSYGGQNPVLDKESVFLQNSNGAVTVAGSVMEAQSGVEKLFFYFERKDKDGNNPRVYNVMESHSDATHERTLNRSNIGSDVTLNGDGLPVLSVTSGITKDSNDNKKFTYADGGTNANIREGGYVIINNRYYKITDKTSQGVFTLEEGIEEAYTKADFVYAMCVDHSGESNKADGSGIDNDDGDGMVESSRTSGTNWIWSAEVNTSNIPDGPVELHLVAFDAAGNHSHNYAETRVSNNAPRLASVKLGTDLNHNDKYESDEYTTFYANKNNYGEVIKTWKDLKEVWNLKPSEEAESSGRDWIIKNGLSVVPEFVGGTAPYYYVFSKAAGVYDDSTAETKEATKGKRLTSAESNASKDLTSATGTTGATGKLYATKASGKYTDTAITLANSSFDSSATYEDKVNTYHFSFWDSTEESTAGKDTGSTVLNVELRQDVVDGVRPESFIHPFFWKGKGKGTVKNPNNSIQWTTATADADEEALGHIELDVASGSGLAEASDGTASGKLGTDPKVSGKIVLRGTAYDETRLTEINITSNDSLIIGSSGITANYVKQDDDSYLWVESTGALTVTDMNGGVTQKGHLVEWSLEVDTEKVTGVVKPDVTFTVKAKDGTAYTTVASGTAATAFASSVYATTVQAASGKYYSTQALAKNPYVTDAEGNKTDAATVDVGKHSPRQIKCASEADDIYEYSYGTTAVYQMDVVPYVTSVVTSLTSKDVNTKGKYSRTSLGHYPVQSAVSNDSNDSDSKKAADRLGSETITFKGFNLTGKNDTAGNKPTTVTVTQDSKTTDVTVTQNLKDADGKEKGTLEITAAKLKSAELELKVNGIGLMNNLNDNDAKGQCASEGTAYANCYNRMPNNDNNNLLTDDIWFDVWEFNDRVAVPRVKSLGGTIMKVNSHSNQIQYGFSDGVYFRMGNSTKDDSGTVSGDSSHTCLYAYDTFQTPSVGFHVDADGYTVAATHSSDTNSSQRIDFVRFATSRWGIPGATTIDSTDKVNCLEGTGKVKTRIERQRIWSTTFASTPGNIYMAYYDLLEKQIRFRAGNIGDTTKKGAFDMFNDENTSQYTATAATHETNNTGSLEIVASSADSTLLDAGRGAGKFVSIAASQYKDASDNTKDAVSMVWFDQDTGSLKYSYIQDPIGNMSSIKGKSAAENWTSKNATDEKPKTPETIMNGGQYCQIAAAADGTIHVAAYGDDGYLYYAYAANYTGNFTVVKVDATDDVGKNLTLDVALKVVGKTAADADIKKAIPYIGYKSSIGYPKYAYLKDSAAKDANYNGVDGSNRYTGNWDISVVPSTNALFINQEDHINVGVWKNTSSGVLKSSGTGTSSVAATSSITYGNSTSNGVLVYQVVDNTGTYTDVLESAQMR